MVALPLKKPFVDIYTHVYTGEATREPVAEDKELNRLHVTIYLNRLRMIYWRQRLLGRLDMSVVYMVNLKCECWGGRLRF